MTLWQLSPLVSPQGGEVCNFNSGCITGKCGKDPPGGGDSGADGSCNGNSGLIDGDKTCSGKKIWQQLDCCYDNVSISHCIKCP